MRSTAATAEVLDYHLKCFADRDLDAVLADYSADAVFFGPEGALREPNAIKMTSVLLRLIKGATKRAHKK